MAVTHLLVRRNIQIYSLTFSVHGHIITINFTSDNVAIRNSKSTLTFQRAVGWCETVALIAVNSSMNCCPISRVRRHSHVTGIDGDGHRIELTSQEVN